MEIIRTATPADAPVLAAIEAECFPAAEAASPAAIAARLAAYPQHFYLMEENGRAVGFINGPVTDRETIADEMYEDTGYHREQGAYQSVFGLDVLPAYRRSGRAARLMGALIADARLQGRRGCILTCKEKLIPYYAKFGYRCLGVSDSVHGGAVWYDMLKKF